jgi:phosphoribosylformylglycinamidine synthase
VAALESHNHPSAIEPYGGAATGIGGIVRDVVCMGAQPLAFVDPLFFGTLDYPFDKLPQGAKHPRYLFKGVVEGIRDYGNRIGIPTAAGMVFFHQGYLGNCLVNVGCVGIVKKNKILHSRVKDIGNIYVYAGGKTGRDGIHGVTFASAELHEKSEETSRSAVQLGDPITKEPLIHACLECNEKGLLEGLKDFGGGGLSCVCGELAYDAGLGAEIILDKIPLKEEGMAPWEIWVSESQERMMLVVHPRNIEKVLRIFRQWDVLAIPVGKVIKQPLIRVYHKEKIIAEMDLEFQTGGPVYERPHTPPEIQEDEKDFKMPDLNKTLLMLLASPNISSREWVIREYDHEVRGNTIIKPLQGEISRQTHGDATIIKPLPNSYQGIALTTDVNPYFTAHHPYWGACSTVDETYRNLISVGSQPDSLADCLNFANPEKPKRLGEMREACRGIGDMARELKLPFISGNVSFYNETPDGPIPPTPTILGIGIIPDVRKAVTVEFKDTKNPIYIIGQTKKEMGGSEYYHALQIPGGIVPRSNPHVLHEYSKGLKKCIDTGIIRACHDVSNGGIGTCLSEMVIGGKGAIICLYPLGNLRSDIKLFSESNTRWIVEIEKKKTQDFENIMKKSVFHKIGEVGGERLTIYDNEKMDTIIDLPRNTLVNAWKEELWKIMG